MLTHSVCVYKSMRSNTLFVDGLKYVGNFINDCISSSVFIMHLKRLNEDGQTDNELFAWNASFVSNYENLKIVFFHLLFGVQKHFNYINLILLMMSI